MNFVKILLIILPFIDICYLHFLCKGDQPNYKNIKDILWDKLMKFIDNDQVVNKKKEDLKPSSSISELIKKRNLSSNITIDTKKSDDEVLRILNERRKIEKAYIEKELNMHLPKYEKIEIWKEKIKQYSFILLILHISVIVYLLFYPNK